MDMKYFQIDIEYNFSKISITFNVKVKKPIFHI